MAREIGMSLMGLGEGVLDWVAALHKIRHLPGKAAHKYTYMSTAAVELDRLRFAHIWNPQQTLISA